MRRSLTGSIFAYNDIPRSVPYARGRLVLKLQKQHLQEGLCCTVRWRALNTCKPMRIIMLAKSPASVNAGKSGRTASRSKVQAKCLQETVPQAGGSGICLTVYLHGTAAAQTGRAINETWSPAGICGRCLSAETSRSRGDSTQSRPRLPYQTMVLATISKSYSPRGQLRSSWLQSCSRRSRRVCNCRPPSIGVRGSSCSSTCTENHTRSPRLTQAALRSAARMLRSQPAVSTCE